MIGSTGSPLSPERFRWVYEAVAENVHLASISGGTDLCGCFMAGVPTRPVFAGEIQGPALAMDTLAVDDHGRPVVDAPGELVCATPFPTVPLRFVGDDGTRFGAAYFERFPGRWHHGDFVIHTARDGFIVLGRSDTTLNPGGVRIGTAEIYRQVDDIPGVEESLVVGQPWQGDVRIVLLLRLSSGAVLDEELRTEVRQRIRTGCTPRHVPAVIAQVEDLPRTRSNKLVELAVADVAAGRPVRNTEAIANPEALDAIRHLPELGLA
jgi:acetoacetyl-CoA synthetase